MSNCSVGQLVPLRSKNSNCAVPFGKESKRSAALARRSSSNSRPRHLITGQANALISASSMCPLFSYDVSHCSSLSRTAVRYRFGEASNTAVLKKCIPQRMTQVTDEEFLTITRSSLDRSNSRTIRQRELLGTRSLSQQFDFDIHAKLAISSPDSVYQQFSTSVEEPTDHARPSSHPLRFVTLLLYHEAYELGF